MVYLFPELIGYIKPNSLPYSDFQPEQALKRLLYPAKGQKNKAVHRKFITDYMFTKEDKTNLRKRKIRADKGKKKTAEQETDKFKKLEKMLKFAPTRFKYNTDNYINSYNF